jgi:hypothetical protein
MVSFNSGDSQGQPVVPGTKISWRLASIAGVLLLIGLVFYLTCRPILPAPLQYLGVPQFPLAMSIKPNVFVGSFPSFIHVAALTLMTCALLRPSVLSAFVVGSIWAGIDVLWEFSCADGQAWLRLGGKLFDVGYVPACTYDSWDIVASIAGAAAATGITWFVLKFYSVPFSTAQERQK